MQVFRLGRDVDGGASSLIGAAVCGLKLQGRHALWGRPPGTGEAIHLVDSAVFESAEHAKTVIEATSPDWFQELEPGRVRRSDKQSHQEQQVRATGDDDLISVVQPCTASLRGERLSERC